MTATIQLLCEKPLRDISIEEIARKAGVGKTTIYKWWPSKVYVAFDAFLKKTNRILPTPDTGSARSDILEQLRSLMVFYISPAGPILGQFVAESQIDKQFASLFREGFIEPMREAVGIIVDRGVERGEIDQSLNREFVLDLIYDLAIYRTIVKHDSLEDKLTDEMVSVLFGGLDNRCQEKARITGKTHHNHTIRIISKLAEPRGQNPHFSPQRNMPMSNCSYLRDRSSMFGRRFSFRPTRTRIKSFKRVISAGGDCRRRRYPVSKL